MAGDPQVKCLSQFLPVEGFAVISAGTFGIITERAVIVFQEKYAPEILAPLGRTKGAGFVVANTLPKINAIKGGGII